MLGSAPTAKERQEQRLREQAEAEVDRLSEILSAIKAGNESVDYSAPESKALKLREEHVITRDALTRWQVGALTEELRAA